VIIRIDIVMNTCQHHAQCTFGAPVALRDAGKHEVAA